MGVREYCPGKFDIELRRSSIFQTNSRLKSNACQQSQKTVIEVKTKDEYYDSKLKRC